MDSLPHAGALHPPSQIDIGEIHDRSVEFVNWRGESDRPEPAPPAPLPPDERVGFAIMGLGRLALGQILPAFAACNAARPVAVISDRPEKARLVATQYGIAPERVFAVADIPRLADDPLIQAVYVVTPNGLHLPHVRAIAAAGKHVLCEKPMANTSTEARAMIAACAAAKVKLMIAYRCHYQPHNATVRDMLAKDEFGAVRLIEASNTQMQGPIDQWRFVPELAGGGALPDIGLYCLNGVRMMLGEEPVEVFATIHRPAGDPRYAVLDETVSFMLRFPSGAIANCAASYGAHESKDMRIHTERGLVTLENAFAYKGQRLRIARREGNGEAIEERILGGASQFSAEIDHFADAILHDRTPDTPGEEGLRDHLLLEAIYRSAAENRPIALGPDGAARA